MGKMSDIKDLATIIGKILEEIRFLNRSFMYGGIIFTTLSIYNQYGLGLKIGLITFIFGGVFRIQESYYKTILGEGKKFPNYELFSMAVRKRYLIVSIILGVYAIIIGITLELVF